MFETLAIVLVVIGLLWSLGLFKPVVTLSQMASDKVESIADDLYVSDIKKAKSMPSAEEVAKAAESVEVIRAARRAQWGK